MEGTVSVCNILGPNSCHLTRAARAGQTLMMTHLVESDTPGAENKKSELLLQSCCTDDFALSAYTFKELLTYDLIRKRSICTSLSCTPIQPLTHRHCC